MPEGTTLETTEAAAARPGRLPGARAGGDGRDDHRRDEPARWTSTAWCGTTTCGRGRNVADVRVNLVAKKRRAQQSHAIALRLRNDLQAIAQRHGANIKIVESPPGPPVISTLVAEVYGSAGQSVRRAGRRRAAGATTHGGHAQRRGCGRYPGRAADPAAIRRGSHQGGPQRHQRPPDRRDCSTARCKAPSRASLRLDDQVNPGVGSSLQLPRDRAQPSRAGSGSSRVRSTGGEAVPLTELGRFEETTIDQPIYHKNLRPVVYVFGDTAGLPPPVAVFTLSDKVKQRARPEPAGRSSWAGEGEWEITIRVFRDLGIAFGVAVLGIYILLLYQTQSYLLPAIQLVALPLTIIGIMPGFWLLNVPDGQERWTAGSTRSTSRRPP